MTGDEWRTHVGERLKAAREARRLSVRAAAQRAGISEALWRQIERGTRQVAQGIEVPVNPKGATLEAVAQAVGLNPAEVFGWAGRPYEDPPVLAERELPGGRRIMAAADALAAMDDTAIDALIRALEMLRETDT